MRWILGWWLALWALPALAQEVRISADQPARVPLVIAVGEQVTVTALGGEAIDTTLTLLDATGAVVAYSDDRLIDGQLVRDAQITHDEAGMYTLVVDSFNGVSEGRVRLEVTRQPLAISLQLPDEQLLALSRQRPLRVRLVLDAPATVQLSVESIGRRLDLLVWLVAADGQRLYVASGHQRARASAQWSLPTGDHELWIVDWLGRAGSVHLMAWAAP